MADPTRYHYMDSATGRRSPPLYNPARSSMPVTGGGYGSLYSGDLHVMSASHHEGVPPSSDVYRTSAVPVTSNTYAVRKEPLPRSTSLNDGHRVHRPHDQGAKRPVIVTTKHHQTTSRSGSPSRDTYRSSDEGGPYYTEPASSIPRSRAVASHTPASATMDEEEYRRLKDRTHLDRLGTQASRGTDAHRPRPASLYAGPSHRSTNSHDFDDQGYEYSKPSDLARYDLDHDQRNKTTRRETLDRYYRPTVSISEDLTRPFDPSEKRGRGPPPATRGLEKIGWGQTAGGIYDGAGSHMPLLPTAPPAPDVRRPKLLEAPGSPREEHRTGPRPLPMIQDVPSRPSHHEDQYYYDDPRDQNYFQDDRVSTRGFGILVDANDAEEHRRPAGKVYHDDRRPVDKLYYDERRERREPRKRYEDREARRHSDDDLEIVKRKHDERDHRRYRDRDEDVEEALQRRHERDREHERRERKPDNDEPASTRDKIRDKAVAGVGAGLAAAAVGLKSAMKQKSEDQAPSKHAGEDRDRPRRDEGGTRGEARGEARGKSTREDLLGDEEFEIVEHPRDGERSPRPQPRLESEAPDSRKRDDSPASPSPRDRSPLSDDEGGAQPRRRRPQLFDPNDTAVLADIREKIQSLKTLTKDYKEASDSEDAPPPTKQESAENKPAPVEKREDDPESPAAAAPSKDDETPPAPRPREEKQVRVVAPPKETDKKPIKGILKQPRAQFPEEPNPVREGVAPHKDDKSKNDVPRGARWTKISRKLVNPDALKIGKERFEVRDDFVVVLRVLSKQEIQAYAEATVTLRGKFS
ncbi:uncharacterized protein C8A04DRAFT_10365 [Dichotomopilus funicola]|uniref:DUF8035 domain-containing protein n=1 Tax=Dichotomopilus funicola TaxID=1934379 RepID=A0AAN6V6Q1_9PEZI|nr:hypothetical protein C8A04DRAFT_10365 [Dichotomopilus funicola]